MRFILVLLMISILAGCGESRTVQKEPGDDPGILSCPEYNIKGQPLEEVPEEEMEQYDLSSDMLMEEMGEKKAKETRIQLKRKETFQAALEQEGVSLDDLMTLGGMLVADTSIVVQLKEDLPGEEREAVHRAIEQVRETYNEEAVIIDEVPISQEEKRQRVTEVMDTLKEHEAIGAKLSSVGSCGGGSMDIEAGFLEELEEEEIDVVRSSFDFKVYTKVAASETSGYVTEVEEGRMLIDFTWFSSAPPDVEVGDFATVTHGAVAESFPAQSSAYKTKIREARHLGEAEKTDREVVREALASGGESPLNVTEVTYEPDQDEWSITISKGVMNNDEKETVTIAD
ncbi:hypothetical protein [Salimicrobium flavidum]|uniref:Uncharacterized protein n=1 Tax=Salimicrobium flavidum TaxID=570947 RepID=A0A1N7J9E4_9BACI|nr:hypothetical protein [Salimicrobium flavidum]SIS45930.1 hypothetical protein SAMN05421687_104203 [Salimicrobium flavidum]